jgi:NTE family protein
MLSAEHRIDHPKKIKNIAFAGGGFFGIAHVGALKELEKHCSKEHFKRFAGVSVGSMIAALYAVGYTPDEMERIMIETDFDGLIRDNYFAYVKVYDSFGMYQANALETEIERLIRIKTNIRLCTFNQIPIDLTIIATNLNYQRPRLFNRDTTPFLPISQAIRMSISYPIIMTPVLFEGDYYGDGGEFINYPITIFDNLDETIGLTFAAYGENDDGTLRLRQDIKDVYEYIASIANTLCRANYVGLMKKKYLRRSIVIRIKENISSMQFNLSLEQKKAILQWGEEAVQNSLNIIN